MKSTTGEESDTKLHDDLARPTTEHSPHTIPSGGENGTNVDLFTIDDSSMNDGYEKKKNITDIDFEYADGIYNIPLITPYLRTVNVLRYCPISPNFAYGSVTCRSCKKHNKIV